MPTFDEQDVYNKHQTSCDCEDPTTCGCNDDCGCCPPGLVAVTVNGQVSCLTPNDAACFTSENHIPAQGYQKVYNPTTGQYIGDMTIEDALAYYTAFGTVTPTVTPGLYNPVTIDAVSVASVPPVGTNQVHVDFQVDRISCLEAVTLSFGAGAPAGMSFFGSAVTATIAATESILNGDGIEITDAVAPGTYPVEIVYASCENSKTRIINVTVT